MVRRHLVAQPVVTAPLGRPPLLAPPLRTVVAGGLGQRVTERLGQTATAGRLARPVLARSIRHCPTAAGELPCVSQLVSKRGRRGIQPVVLRKRSELTRCERIIGSARSPLKRRIIEPT